MYLLVREGIFHRILTILSMKIMSTGCFLYCFLYIFFFILILYFYIEHEDNVNWLFFILFFIYIFSYYILYFFY